MTNLENQNYRFYWSWQFAALFLSLATYCMAISFLISPDTIDQSTADSAFLHSVGLTPVKALRLGAALCIVITAIPWILWVLDFGPEDTQNDGN